MRFTVPLLSKLPTPTTPHPASHPPPHPSSSPPPPTCLHTQLRRHSADNEGPLHTNAFLVGLCFLYLFCVVSCPRLVALCSRNVHLFDSVLPTAHPFCTSPYRYNRSGWIAFRHAVLAARKAAGIVQNGSNSGLKPTDADIVVAVTPHLGEMVYSRTIEHLLWATRLSNKLVSSTLNRERPCTPVEASQSSRHSTIGCFFCFLFSSSFL